jgi:hypothetical protein
MSAVLALRLASRPWTRGRSIRFEEPCLGLVLDHGRSNAGRAVVADEIGKARAVCRCCEEEGSEHLLA